MGTSLTGLTPATTYDALIKVGDNGPLSATAKILSDGLGNDSPLAMSTTLVGIGTTTPLQKLHVAQDVTYSASQSGQLYVGGTNTGKRLMLGYDTTNNFGFIEGVNFGVAYSNICLNPTAGNVGIGTSTPNTPLSLVAEHVGGQSTLKIQPITSYASSGLSSIGFNDSDGTRKGLVLVEATGMNIITESTSPIRFSVNSVERGRWTTDGLCFNGDTAAANALDDYEEGTWTIGISFGGGSTGVTYNLNLGAYTKIGRQVTVTGFLQLSSKGSSTGFASITGLPFTVAGNLNRLSAPSLWLNNLSFTDQFQGYCNQGTTKIEMYQITNAGVASTLNDTNFSNNTEIMLSATYYI